MQQPWSAEHVVDERLACQLLEAKLPQLPRGEIQPFGEGWDNTAFLVDGTWVFRFPRQAHAVPQLLREVRLLPTLAPHLPVPIPVPEHLCTPGPGFPWPFAGYRILAGTTADRASPSPEQRTAIAPTLARALLALHGFGLDEARAKGAVGDEWKRLDVNERAPIVTKALVELIERGLLGGQRFAALQRLFDCPRAPDLPPAVLVHGDLYSRHLVLDDAGALAGIIDWGDVHVGHRAVDLSAVFSFLPPRAREAFWHVYGAPGEDEVRLARFRALNHTVVMLRYAADAGDAALVREGQHALGWLDVD